jgi:hypothetical protein
VGGKGWDWRISFGKKVVWKNVEKVAEKMRNVKKKLKINCKMRVKILINENKKGKNKANPGCVRNNYLCIVQGGGHMHVFGPI